MAATLPNMAACIKAAIKQKLFLGELSVREDLIPYRFIKQMKP